jgi:uncharacterized membrane protein
VGKNRPEAFSDGVLAIIITIAVLGLRPQHGTSVAALRPVLPVFASYVLSFVCLGIYWNNHHHMLATVDRVSGGILWAKLHLLFWLSLVPFVTGWMGASRFAAATNAVYGAVLLLAAIAYFILQSLIVASQGEGSLLAAAIGRDLKGKASPIIYVVAIAAAFLAPWIAGALYTLLAIMWLIPDRRIERAFAVREES